MQTITATSSSPTTAAARLAAIRARRNAAPVAPASNAPATYDAAERYHSSNAFGR